MLDTADLARHRFYKEESRPEESNRDLTDTESMREALTPVPEDAQG
jgi:hypothetical protein